ncbi:MAG: O-antigen ligase family protein [Bacteroidia bacterium]|nr:O-antigen ligase family protein [Bacteroidia bacterium]
MNTAINWKDWAITLFACIACGYVASRHEGMDMPFVYAAAGLPLFAWLLLTQAERMWYLTILLIPISSPRGIEGGYVYSFPSEAMTAVLCLYLIVLQTLRPFITKEIFRHPIVLMILIEVGWMLFCSFFSNEPTISFKRVTVRFLFVSMFLLMAVHVFLKYELRYHWIIVLYAIGFIWPVISSFLFHARFGFSLRTAYKMTHPYYNDHTIYGAAVAFLLPMLTIISFTVGVFRFRIWQQVLLISLTAFFFVAEALSYSRAAWISLAFALLMGIFLIFKVQFRTILIMLITVAGVIYINSERIYNHISTNDAISNQKEDVGNHLMSVTNIQSDASNTERINRWLCAWRMALDKPITGFGPGMYQFEYGQYQRRGEMTRISTFSGNRGHAHSEFMTQLSEDGFPGFILFTVIVFYVIASGMRVVYREKILKYKLTVTGALLGLITFYVHGAFNAFLDSDKMAALVFTSIAVIVAHDIRQKRKVQETSDGNNLIST